GSMEHKIASDEAGRLHMCGNYYQEKRPVNFDFFWAECGEYYRLFGINMNSFEKYPFKNGFDTGDIIVLIGKKAEDIKIGDVIVFKSNQPDPIIHRVIKKWETEGEYHFQTKGDHNGNSIQGSFLNEIDIKKEQIIGKAVFRIPFLGYIKIWFVQLLDLLNLNMVKRLF
ncbi:signal peptidase I, partial [Candidatus Woesearchaeota archaeon]|nr:signal peptidase I [Candidatus Woesearchaeota archaeon]